MNATRLLIKHVKPVRDELAKRLEFTFSEADEVALATALTKAAQGGFRAGVQAAELAARARGVPLALDVDMPDYDGWQIMYAEASDG